MVFTLSILRVSPWTHPIIGPSEVKIELFINIGMDYAVCDAHVVCRTKLFYEVKKHVVKFNENRYLMIMLFVFVRSKTKTRYSYKCLTLLNCLQMGFR